MRAHGYDITAHRAQQATLPILSACDLILVMEQAHAAWITRQYPQLRGRVHLLGRWRDHREVADPLGHPRAAFEAVYQEIAQGVQSWLPRIA